MSRSALDVASKLLRSIKEGVRIYYYACSRAHIRYKMGIKGIYLRFKRISEIYRGDAENEIKMQKNAEIFAQFKKKQ